jgi:hypothetical protein
MVAAGTPVRARVSARRRASGSRYRPAMCRTRSAASAAGIPAAVTNSGRAEDPRMTGTAWVAVRNRDFGHPYHRDAELGVRMRAQAGPTGGVQVGVAVDHQRAQPAQIRQDRAQRRQLAQVELTRPVGRYPRYRCGVFSKHVREGGIGGQHGCRPCPAGAQVMHGWPRTSPARPRRRGGTPRRGRCCPAGAAAQARSPAPRRQRRGRARRAGPGGQSQRPRGSALPGRHIPTVGQNHQSPRGLAGRCPPPTGAAQ